MVLKFINFRNDAQRNSILSVVSTKYKKEVIFSLLHLVE